MLVPARKIIPGRGRGSVEVRTVFEAFSEAKWDDFEFCHPAAANAEKEIRSPT
jgi:hypothetical protein